jgi:hypothetical protein
MFLFIPQLRQSTQFAFTRLKTLNAFSSDENVGESLSSEKRIDYRLPKVLKGFAQNPITGLGFSDIYLNEVGEGSPYGDPHVGNFNLLANIGLIGFLLFSYLWIVLISKLKKSKRILSDSNPYKDSLTVLMAGFIGLLLAHFTSYQLFGVVIMRNKFIFLAFYFIFINFIINSAHKEESKSLDAT